MLYKHLKYTWDMRRKKEKKKAFLLCEAQDKIKTWLHIGDSVISQVIYKHKSLVYSGWKCIEAKAWPLCQMEKNLDIPRVLL